MSGGAIYIYICAHDTHKHIILFIIPCLLSRTCIITHNAIIVLYYLSIIYRVPIIYTNTI